MSKHTPAPWAIAGRSDNDGEAIIIESNDRTICWTALQGYGKSLTAEDRANARLIAASPELLFAARCALADLEGILPEFEPSGDREHPAWETLKLLREVVTKVGGRSK